MKRAFLFLAIGISAIFCSAQARLVFNSTGTALGQHPCVVFDNNPLTITAPCYLVIENPATNAITLTGVTSGVPIIKSEAEHRQIRWATGTNTGVYNVPFSTATNVAIPLTVNISTAGSGGANPSLVFATYNYSAKYPAIIPGDYWNNFLYMPEDVTHMNDEPTGLSNNSVNAIDRFWIVDAAAPIYFYGTKPAVTISLGFDPADALANGVPGNSAGLAAVLRAQRFNSTINHWFDIGQLGALSGNAVSGIAVSPADFYRSWTLASSITPLPIELLDWRGACNGNDVQLSWTTASEKDNDHFTIEKSMDAVEWMTIGTLPGAGNSNSMLAYAFIDQDASTLAYYRLRQTDFNGTSVLSHVITAGCSATGGTAIVNAWNRDGALYLDVFSGVDGVYDLTLLDVEGRVLATRAAQAISSGNTELQVDTRGIATGIYVVRLANGTGSMARRVHLD
jgi:hypothetical protein